MSLAGFAGVGDISTQAVSGLPGQAFLAEPGGALSGVWFGGATAQVQRTTITGASNSTTYTLTCTIYGVVETASYTSDGSATTAEIAAGLAAAVQNLPHFGSYVTVDYTSGTALFDTAGPADGTSFSITDASAQITQAVTTAAATGSDASPGQLVIVDLTKSILPTPSLLPTSALTAGTALLTLTYASGSVYTAEITVAGQAYVVNTVGATDLATTVGNLITAINGALPSNTVLAATGGTGEITLTAEVAGQAFGVLVSSHTGAGTIALTSTSGLPTDNVIDCFGGVVQWGLVEDAALGVNAVEFSPGSVIGVQARGTIVIPATSSSPTGAWVVVATGEIVTSGGAGRCYLPPALALNLGPIPHGAGSILRLASGNIIPA